MPRPTTLSYALNKKSDKLLKAFKNRNAYLRLMTVVGVVTGMLWIYFLANMGYFINSWSPLYSSSSIRHTLLEEIYLRILFIASILFLFTYGLWSKYNDKYKKYKKEVLKILEVEACNHRSPCDCKDKYCIWLEEEEGIDLI